MSSKHLNYLNESYTGILTLWYPAYQTVLTLFTALTCSECHVLAGIQSIPFIILSALWIIIYLGTKPDINRRNPEIFELLFDTNYGIFALCILGVFLMVFEYKYWIIGYQNACIASALWGNILTQLWVYGCVFPLILALIALCGCGVCFVIAMVSYMRSGGIR